MLLSNYCSRISHRLCLKGFRVSHFGKTLEQILIDAWNFPLFISISLILEISWRWEGSILHLEVDLSNSKNGYLLQSL